MQIIKKKKYYYLKYSYRKGKKVITKEKYLGKTIPKDIKESLIRQLENPVLWFDTIKNMTNDSYTSYIEIGPGKVLQGLNRKIDKTLSNRGIESHEDIITYEV